MNRAHQQKVFDELHQAIQTEHLPLVARLLETCSIADLTTVDVRRLLVAAVELPEGPEGDGILRALLAAGIPTADFDWEGNPLTIAAGKGDLSRVEILLDAGADPNVLGRTSDGGTFMGFSPLHAAASATPFTPGHLAVLHRLHERGAVIDIFDAYLKRPLDHAIEVGNAAAIPFLRANTLL